MSSSSSYLLSYLLGQLPLLIVYFTAVVLALAWRSRNSLASSLVLAGSVLAILLFAAWGLLMQQALNSSGGPQRLQAVRIALNLLQAVAHGLIIAAAFVGRGRRHGLGFEVQPPPLATRQ